MADSKQPVKLRFYIGLFSLIAVSAALYLALDGMLSLTLASWRFWLTLGVISALVLLSFRMTTREDDEHKARPFVNRFMGSVLLKLLGGMVFFIILAWNAPKDQVLPFGISFLGLYISFAAFESYHSMKWHGKK